MKKLILLMFVFLLATVAMAQQQRSSITLDDGSKAVLIADNIIGGSITMTANDISTSSKAGTNSISGECVVTFSDEMIAEAVVECINDNGGDIFRARLTEKNVFELIYTPPGSENATIGRGNVTFTFPSSHEYREIFQDIMDCDPVDAITMDCN